MQVKAGNLFDIEVFSVGRNFFYPPNVPAFSPIRKDPAALLRLPGDHVEIVSRWCVCVSVMEALQKKHKEDLVREVEKVKRLNSGVIDSQSLLLQQE